ncbi:MAG: hypothetical protein NTZ38_00415 [Candidatus Taylorbacteria bacterium]|nr:hypothetical protein [Candidatus Taylorbacteria bacterium]
MGSDTSDVPALSRQIRQLIGDQGVLILYESGTRTFRVAQALATLLVGYASLSSFRLERARERHEELSDALNDYSSRAKAVAIMVDADLAKRFPIHFLMAADSGANTDGQGVLDFIMDGDTVILDLEVKDLRKLSFRGLAQAQPAKSL